VAVTSHSAKGKLAGRQGLGPADLGMFFVALCWGVNFPLVKHVIAVLDPLVFNALRLALALLTLPVLALVLRTDLRVARSDLWKLLALGLLGNAAYQLFFIHGIALTTASNTSVMLATSPVQVALVGALLGIERIGRWGWLGVFACLGGIVLLVTGGGGQIGLGGPTLAGDLLILCGCASWAFYTVGSKPLIRCYGAMRVTVYCMMLGIWPLLLIALPRMPAQPWDQVGWGMVAVIVFSGVVAIAIAYVLWNLGVKHLGATRTAVYVTIPPVITALIGWLWLGERFSALQWLGAALTLAGVLLTRLSTAAPTPAKEVQGGEED